MIAMRKFLTSKVLEALLSVLPITVILIAVRFIFVQDMPNHLFYLMLMGSVLLVIGMFLFSLGSDIAILPIGEMIGNEITRIKKLFVLLAVCFLIGLIITIAEPDLQVLAMQVENAINKYLYILTVAVGVGLFLIMGMLRVIFKIKLKYIFAISYGLVLILSVVINFVNPAFLPLAYDSGGVTTGPITTPFILAMAMGLSSVKGGGDSEENSFGLIAICSIGPILSVLILRLFFNDPNVNVDISSSTVEAVSGFGALSGLFFSQLPVYLKEVAISLAPILLFFTVFQLTRRSMTMERLKGIALGVILTYLGVAIFLTGANIGFMPAGEYIGAALGGLDYNWVIYPIGFVIGLFMVAAEPAVHVLNKQVENITGGAITRMTMLVSLALGVALSICLNMLRIVYDINIIYFLFPGYLLAIVLMFFTPELFYSIGFDSGGVASGTMAAAFFVPFSLGIAASTGSTGTNLMVNTFGAIAMVAMMPIIVIEVLGLIYKYKTAKAKKASAVTAEDDYTIIELY